MPTIGWFEILIIVTVAILVVGPKDFPKMLKKIGSWIGSTKRYLTNVQREVTEFQDIDTKNQENEKNINIKTNNNKDEQE